MVRKDNQKLINRLINFKFRSAQKYLEGEDDDVVEVVNALATLFDNCGWIEGNMGIMIQCCIAKICPFLDEN